MTHPHLLQGNDVEALGHLYDSGVLPGWYTRHQVAFLVFSGMVELDEAGEPKLTADGRTFVEEY